MTSATSASFLSIVWDTPIEPRTGFSIMGVICFVLGVAFRITNARHRRQGIGVVVEIVENRESMDSEGETYYYPVFRIVSGPYKSVEWSSEMGNNPPLHMTGERVPGLYNPHTGVIRSDSMVRIGAPFADIFIVFGVGLALVALYPSGITFILLLLAAFGAFIRLFRAYKEP